MIPDRLCALSNYRGILVTSSSNRFTLFTLSGIMCTRMLGLFMILPVFSVYAMHLLHASKTSMGVALGIYGLTQAIFQMPFGILSDHIGRKPVIFAGLCMLIIGSIICANASSIDTLCIGRALQGAGAIGSTVLAFVADVTPEATRGKAMAFIGLSIGTAFIVAMIAGPLIAYSFHLSGIFWVTALLACIGMLFLIKIPAHKIMVRTSTTREKFLNILSNPSLIKLNLSIFFLHAILTALFVAIPLMLTQTLVLSQLQQISLYFGVLCVSFMFAIPCIVIAEKKQKMSLIFLCSISVILSTQIALLFFHQDIIFVSVLLFIFFTAFTVLEATLPSQISKIVPPHNKGAAMGIYSSCQFLGIFTGGTLGGIVLSHAAARDIFALCGVIAVLWLAMVLLFNIPQLQNTKVAGNLRNM